VASAVKVEDLMARGSIGTTKVNGWKGVILEGTYHLDQISSLYTSKAIHSSNSNAGDFDT
jgi:hypothetical protein